MAHLFEVRVRGGTAIVHEAQPWELPQRGALGYLRAQLVGDDELLFTAYAVAGLTHEEKAAYADRMRELTARMTEEGPTPHGWSALPDGTWRIAVSP